VSAESAPARVTARRSTLGALLRRPTAVVSLGFLALIVLGAIAAPLIAPYGPLTPDFLHALAGPSSAHLLGTDALGRDVLSRLMYGARPSLLACAVTVLVALGLGVSGGLIAGYTGGWTDSVVSRFGDVLLSVPAFIILLVVVTIFPTGLTLASVTLGVLFSPAIMRVVRSAVLSVRHLPYIDAARVAGLPPRRIMFQEVLPRVTGPVVVQASLTAGAALLTVTGLGFLGFGTQPPQPSWGSLIADGEQVMQQQSFLLIASGGIVALTVLAFVLFSDSLRDVLAARWAPVAASPRPRGKEPVAADHAEDDAALSAGTGKGRPLLRVQGLSVAIGHGAGERVLTREVSFAVMQGESVGIVGESGSGKSITVKAILGLLPGGAHVTAGEVYYDGNAVSRFSRRERTAWHGSKVGFISQEPIASLDPRCTVGHLLTSIVRLHDDCSRSEAKVRVLELLDMVRLPDPADVFRAYPHQLSGGMAQRISIAAALAGRPDLLIADEPTTALDVTVQAEILDVLRELQQQLHMSLVLVSHDWGVVADICERVVVMYAGEVVETCGVSTVLTRPRHPYSSALLASDPAEVPSGQRLPTIPGSVVQAGQWPVGCHFADRCKYVTDECRERPVPLTRVDEGHFSRCLHHADLAMEESSARHG
jgi:peptide/nickel transport system permease protein